MIFGYSIGKLDTTLSILKIDRIKKAIDKKEINIPITEKWIGMDMNTKSNYLIAVSSIKPNPNLKQPSYTRLMALDMSLMKLSIRGSLDLREPLHMNSQFFKKIKGYDYFVLGAGGNISIFGLVDAKFLIFNTIRNIYRSWIINVLIFKDHMLPIPYKPENLKLLEFNKRSYNSLVKKELLQSSYKKSNSELAYSIYGGAKARKINLPDLGKIIR